VIFTPELGSIYLYVIKRIHNESKYTVSGVPGTFGVTERISIVIIAVITLIIIIAIIVFLAEVISPIFIGLFVIAIVIGAVLWIYTKLKVKTG
jgi:hypothetical protein